MRKLYLGMSLTLVVLLACVSLVLAQERTVTGRVTDETGSSMPGVNVIVKGTASGTASDADGRFSLSVPGDAAVLIFTFVGYANAEIAVGSRSVVDIQLTPDVQTLSELVVTGYTEQRKADITGAVSVVNVDALKNVQASSISQKLDGRAAGVTVSTSGEPGEGSNVRIRGLGSFRNDGGANDPLWVVDGVQLDGRNNNWLNPNDIETIQVLKDASAASIYGVGAANGVIIVTTKRGKAGKTSVSYNGFVGVQSPVKGYNDFMITDPFKTAEAYSRYLNAIGPENPYYGYTQDGTLPDFIWPVGNLDNDGNTIVGYDNLDKTTLDAYNFPNNLIMPVDRNGVDWWDEVFSPSMITDHTVNVSGGVENSNFNFSAGYMKNNGTMIHTGFERFTMRANSNFKAGKFAFGENMTFSRTERIAQFGSNQDNQNAITGILLSHPFQPVYDLSGVNFAGPKSYSNGPNVVGQQIRGKDNKNISFNFVGSAYASLDLTSWLKAKTLVGADFWNGVTKNFNFPTYERREPSNINSFNETWQQNFQWQWTNTLELNKKVGDIHQISGLVGYEARAGRWQQIGGSLANYFSTNINGWYLNPGLADPSSRNVNSNGSPNSRMSMFAKVDYTLQDKYLFSATIRRDASSRFGPEKTWATFTAFSAGWRISEEAFMSSVDVISDLKLRGGYGETGNDRIDAGFVFDQYGGGTGSSFYDISGTNSLATGYNLVQRGNPAVGWETNKTTNIGIDMTMLDGKVTFVVDVYKRAIEDLLFNPRIPATAGSARPPMRNIGNMENRGIDVTVGYKGNLSQELGFSADLNVTHYRNEITFISDEEIFFPSGGADGFPDYVRNYVGYPMASFFGLTYLGPIRSDQEAAGLPTNTISGNNFAGGWKFADRDDDGDVDGNDRALIGNPHPDMILGLNLGLTYKNFDFNMFLFSSIGNDIFNYQRYYYETGRWGSNFAEYMLTDAWTPENTGARLPALTEDNNASAGVSSSYYIEDGSFLRARTVNIGYNLPSSVLSKVGMSNCRIYVQAQNLFTITNYSGIDPELSNFDIGDGNANSQFLGVDLGSFPSSRIFSVGASIGF